MSSTAIFSLKYDGPALVSHEMDVKDLAPALLAVGEAIEEANRLLNGDRVKIAVNIKATGEGSVLVQLAANQSLIQDAINQTVAMFNSDQINAVLNVAQILAHLGIGGKGLIEIIRWQRNRKIQNVVRIDTGDYKIELEGGDVRVVSKTEIDLLQDLRIRKSLETVVTRPLEREGVDEVAFKRDAEETVIKKEEGVYFQAPLVPEEQVSETEIEQSLEIVMISFQSGGKWRFSDGSVLFFANILDSDFLDNVRQHRAAFAQNDVLKVRLRRTQTLSTNGLKTDYTVVKVLDHKSAAITIKLPFSNDKSEEFTG